MSASLAALVAHLPRPVPATAAHYALGLGNILLCKLALTAPHTGPWRLFRAAAAAPAIAALWVYLAAAPVSTSNADHWGIPILFTSFIARACELLVFFPAETHAHRLVPTTQDTAPIPEPVPPPFTLAKFYWASSLWWSYRGIGWNYCCPLPASSRTAPYQRHSRRTHYILARLRFIVLAWLFYDLMRTLMNLGPARAFFHPNPTLTYAQLDIAQRALYSIMVVTRTWHSLNSSHVMMGMIFVTIGGVMGWEGEIWSPWGWPPLFGNFTELWKYPGLSTMWSRTWQGYNRRWLYVYGWIGISENILGLTHTGISSHPSVPPDASSSANTPSPSGRVSPSHPLPTTPPKLPVKKITPRLMIQNLVKSIIVFTLSGLQHDCGTLSLLRKTRAGESLFWRDVLVLTPFFVLQPLALAAEALVKNIWRAWKYQSHPAWKLGHQPASLTFAERLVGFIWTWVWLGWSASWFVVGCTDAGSYWVQPGEVYPSLVGGLLYGAWLH